MAKKDWESANFWPTACLKYAWEEENVKDELWCQSYVILSKISSCFQWFPSYFHFAGLLKDFLLNPTLPLQSLFQKIEATALMLSAIPLPSLMHCQTNVGFLSGLGNIYILNVFIFVWIFIAKSIILCLYVFHRSAWRLALRLMLSEFLEDWKMVYF